MTPGPAASPLAASGPAADAGSPRAATPRPARAPIKKPGPFPVIAGSLGLFFATTAWLGFQMRAGADPAIGKGEPVVLAAASPAPRQVIKRRVVITRIVEHRPRRAPSTPAAPAAPAASAPAPASASAPAPAPAAPAPAPAAPAPQPQAPLTTRSS